MIQLNLYPNQKNGIGYEIYKFPDGQQSIKIKTFAFQPEVLEVEIVSPFTSFLDLELPNSSAAISDFKLAQNYPNPFNPSTVISYQLPVSSDIRLVIYNPLGQVIRLLVDTNQQPGFYSIQFNAGDLASGIYFYALSFGNKKTIIKKMILIH